MLSLKMCVGFFSQSCKPLLRRCRFWWIAPLLGAISAAVFMQIAQGLCMTAAGRLDAFLQCPSFCQLRSDQRILLSAVAAQGLQMFPGVQI